MRPLLNDLPGVSNSYYSSIYNYRVGDNLCFVFGSNLAGRHGLGAAHTAHLNYGAIYGIPDGPQGQSYGIPTKDDNLSILFLDEIGLYVSEFVNFTRANPDISFFVTPVGTGLSGHEHKDIAPMFRGVINCWLPDVWGRYM